MIIYKIHLIFFKIFKIKEIIQNMKYKENKKTKKNYQKEINKMFKKQKLVVY